jgi:hypothetical protein
MSVVPESGVAPLAGLATYAEAARIGYGVDENVRRLLRYQWTARRVMHTMLAHLTAEPVWEVKSGLALHQWMLAEHVTWIRRRISEMRHPVPALDQAPDPALDRLLEEALRSGDAVELLGGLYQVVLADLHRACREHLSTTNPLVDHPTRRLLRWVVQDLDDMLVWSEAGLAGLLARDGNARDRALAWKEHLQAWLAAAGGVEGPTPAQPGPVPPARASQPFEPDLHPRRDPRFAGRYNFEFPPHVVYNDPKVPADERNLALLCKRTLEMDVPEMMASIMVQRADQPWEFQLDYSRQLWDEMRHAMMGSVAFEARGVDWSSIPLNVGFALRLNLFADPVERQTLLFAIEQSLMPADTGKRFEYRTAEEAGDPLSAHFHDYDWADEVLHAQIGRRWLRREGLTPDAAIERAQPIHEKTWAALDQFRHLDEQRDWWDDFVQRVLGHRSALRPEERAELRIIAE